MKKTKIFAIPSLLLMDALILHLVALSIGMFLNNIEYKLLGITSRIVNIFFIVHVIMSFIKLSKVENKKMTYLKYNYKTLIQRMSGGLMILFLVLHIVLTKPLENVNDLNIVQRLFLFLGEGVFFAIVLTHITVSSPKARLALGAITTMEQVEKAEKVEIIKNSILLVLSLVALAVYIFGGLL